MLYSDRSNMVILRYGKKEPPALVLFLFSANNSTYCSFVTGSSAPRSLIPMR